MNRFEPPVQEKTAQAHGENETMTTYLRTLTDSDAEIDAFYAAIIAAFGVRSATDRQIRDIGIALAAAWSVTDATARLRRGLIVLDLWWDDGDKTHLEATFEGYQRLSARVNPRGVVYAELARVRPPAATVAA